MNITRLLLFIPLLAGCAPHALRIQSDVVVQPDALRLAQVMVVATRDDIVRAEAYEAILTAGVPDEDLSDGSVVLARVYCCGGISQNLSEEFQHRTMLLVPKGMKVGLGDIVELRVGRPPREGDGGKLNTVTRLVQAVDEQERRSREKSETCWWDPKDDRLWLRVLYCDWMPTEGWKKQEGSYPAWFKP